MDTQFTEDYVKQLVLNSKKSTKDRGLALIIAHNVQKKMDTEYGVREMDV